jgi:arylsulfatase A-like enzyme
VLNGFVMKKYLLLLIVSIIFVQPGYLPAAGEGGPPNILLISIDSLRADHLGCYGYDKDTSPVLDELASSGALFENTVSSTSWTLPAHMSLLTSMDISVHGVGRDGVSLHPSIGTVTQVLKKEGYATACFCSSPYMNPAFGFDRGFDLYRNIDLEDEKIKDTILPPPEERDAVHEDITSPRITELAIDWLDKNHSRPFFLFLHLWDVHYDYIPPTPYDKLFDPDYRGKIDGRNYVHNDAVNPEMDPRDLEHIIALYDGEIAYVDYHIGLIVKELKKLGIFDRTLIVVTADHGDEFFEHGEKGHRNTLYDEVTMIPLIFHLPDEISSVVKIPNQVSIIDIAPTVLDLVGIPIPGQMQGGSLTSLLGGTDPPDDRSALLELKRVLKALRSNSWKLLFNTRALQTIILDLKADPEETDPVGITDFSEWSRINRIFYDRLKEDRDLSRAYRGGETGSPVKLSQEQKERLRSLGYTH